ncbi:MAG TPA: hypothetical protein VNA25_09410 [Phycisphaerae bacterium]|nr:hypothetical protein [Phycisphaerae bacterium]
MIVQLTLSPEAKRKIQRDGKLAAKAAGVLADGMEAAAAVGAERIAEMMQMGELGVRPRSTDLAHSVTGWMVNRDTPEGAMGVLGDSPAARYARILEQGGDIYPVRARLLAIPISDEARKHTSPRDMGNLTLIPRRGKPPLLVEILGARGSRRAQWRLHWVLVPHVRIEPRRWLTKGARRAAGDMAAAYQDVTDRYARAW